MKDPVLEVCVDSTTSALAAKQGGASRLELCADLVIGGTTPSLALVRQVKAETGLPVRALLRPRFGDFCYDRYELDQMTQQAAALVEAGNRPDGRWRWPCTGPLMSAGTPLLPWKQPASWDLTPFSPAARPPAPQPVHR